MKYYENEKHVAWMKPWGCRRSEVSERPHIRFHLRGQDLYLTSLWLRCFPPWHPEARRGDYGDQCGTGKILYKDIGKFARTARVLVAKEIGLPLFEAELTDPAVAEMQQKYPDQLAKFVPQLIDELIGRQVVYPREEWAQHPTALKECYVPLPVGRPKGCNATEKHPSKMHGRLTLLEETLAKLLEGQARLESTLDKILHEMESI